MATCRVLIKKKTAYTFIEKKKDWLLSGLELVTPSGINKTIIH